MGVYNQLLTNIVNRGRFISVLLFFFIIVNQISFSQVTACEGGVITGIDVLISANVPPGHRSEGFWLETGGLVFSSINDPNAIIEIPNPASGPYTVEWSYKNKTQIYSLTFNVVSNPVPLASLEANGSSTDLLLCSDASVALDPWINGQQSYEFIVRDHVTGLTNSVATRNDGGVYLLGTNNYEPLDDVFVVVEANNGCKQVSNEITISNVNFIDVQVVGGSSVCQGAAIPSDDLEVIPYSPSSGFTYDWTTPSGPVSGVQTVPITAYGTYYVTVTNAACSGGPFTSDIVTVRNYTLPDVTISGPASICETALSLTLASTISGVPTNPIIYQWDFNGNILAGENNANLIKTTQPLAGSYKAIIVETNNEECWNESNTLNIPVTDIQVTGFSAAAPPNTTVCLNAVPVQPRLNISLSGGIGPWTVTIDDGTSTFPVTVPLGGSITATMNSIAATTTYTIIDIIDASGCAIDPIDLPAGGIVYTVVPAPIQYNVTGGTGCEDAGVSIGLDGAGGEPGVTYELFLNGVSQGFRVGDGNFGLRNAIGIYTMTATGINGCVVSMGSSATVNPLPVNQSFLNTGSLCPSGVVALTNSVTGTTYQLWRDGVYTGLFQIGSTGNSITFGNQTTAGEYSVVAISNGCTFTLTDRLIIEPQPTVFNLSANNTTYCAASAVSGVNLTLSGSEVGVDYQLLESGVPLGAIVIGTGAPIVWYNVTAGSYTVEASNAGGCSLVMNFNPVISSAPAPTATITTQAPDRRCANVVGSFTLRVTLTGTPPFNFTIEDDKGSPPVVVNGHNLLTYSLVVNPVATTTYVVRNLVDAANCVPQAPAGTATVFIDAIPVITFSPPNPEVCRGSAVLVTADGAGIGGTYSWSDGLGNSPSINVAPAATHNYTVIATTALGCSDNNTVTVTVNPLPIVDFTTPGNIYEYCENDANVTLSGNPVGGSFGGTGILPASDIFSPALANIGNNNVTYTYSDPKGCVNNITKQIVANPVPNVFIFGLGTEYCANDGRVTFSGSPTAATGAFSVIGQGAGINVWWGDNGNGTGWFDPTIATAQVGWGTYTFRYTYTDPNTCTAYDEIDVILHPDLNALVSFIGMPVSSCQDDNINYPLQGQVSGVNVASGVFTGPIPGLIDGGNDGTAIFNPFLAGNGTHSIIFTYTDANGCTGSQTQTITIGTDLAIPGLNTEYCKNEPGFNIIGNQTPNGAVRLINVTTGVVTSGFDDPANPGSLVFFDPTVLAAGPYQVEYSYTDGNSCTNSQIWDVVIHPMPDATFEYEKTGGGVEITQYCVSETSVTLTPIVVGGNFTGTAVSGNIFNPSIAGVGTHNITYTITQNGCTTVNTRNDMSVVPLPTIDINNLDPDYCDNEASFTVLASNFGTPGGVWTLTSTTNTLGVSPITDNGDGSAVFDPAVGVGSYTVTMTYIDPAQSCENSISKIVTIYETPEVNFGGANDLLEFCQDDVPITLTASFNTTIPVNAGVFTGDGITDHTNGTATFDPSGLTVGDHPITYTYTNPNGCISTRIKTFRILDYPVLYNVTGGGDFCFANDPTGLPVGLSDSEVGVNYELLLNGLPVAPVNIVAGTGNAISFGDQIAPGVYTVQAVNAASGCSLIMNGSVTIKVNDVTLVVTTTDVLCTSGNDGSATVTASGGTANYVFEWRNSSNVVVANSATASNLVADTYQVTVVDAVGCSSITTGIVINEPNNALSVNVINIKDVGCDCTTGSGICEGSAEVSITGGTTNYTILWSTGGAGTIENDIEPGAHSVMVTDNNGCIVTVPYTITQLPALTIVEDVTVPNHVDNSCNGGNSGQFVVIAGGGSGNYEYSIDNATWLNSPVFTGLTAKNYDVWVRDANYIRCVLQIANPIIITEPAALTLAEVIASHIDVDCNGGATGQLEVIAGGGSGVYNYSIDAGANWQALPIFTTLVQGSYNVWVRDAADNSCVYSGLAPIIITEPTPLNLSIASTTNVSCNGEADGDVVITASGGSGNYVYSIDGGTNWVASNAFNGLIAGVYNFSVKDASSVSCQLINIVNATITEPADFTITVAHTDVSCFGGNDGTITVTPVQVGRQLEYSIDAGANWQVGTIFNNLIAGNYKVSIRDIENAPVICTKIDEMSVDILEPTASVTIDNVAITDVTCNGDNDGAITITVSGGTGVYTYQWTNSLGIAIGGNSNNPTLLVADDYTVVVTDVNGCQTTATYTVTEPAVWNVQYTVTNVSTYGNNDGEIDIHTIVGNTPPYTVSWTDDATNHDIHRTGLTAGTYEFTVDDSNGCTITKSNIVVSQPTELIATVTPSDVKCFGGNDGSIFVDISSGNPNYTISWTGNLISGGTDNGSVTQPQNTYTIVTLEAGTYTVDIIDVVGNTTQSIVVVDQPDQITVTLASSTDITCSGGNDGEITISVTGGSDPANPANYSIIWNGPNGYIKAGLVSAFKTISNLDTPGTYSALVIDPNGCGVVEDFTITAPAYWDVQYTVTNVSTTGNNDGQIDIHTIAGNTGPYTITWGDDNTIHDLLRTGLSAGTYNFTIEDANGCDTTITNIHVTEPGPLSVTVTENDVACYGGNTGSVRVEITSGNPNYIIKWTGNLVSGGTDTGTSDPAPTNLLIDNLEAGSYAIEVTDAVGNIYNETVVVSQPNEIVITAGTVTDITCNGDNDGEITVSVTGGSGPDPENYNITWVGPNAFFKTGNVSVEKSQTTLISAGNYIITVTDNNGCSKSLTIAITAPLVWDVQYSVTHVSTSGNSDGAISINSISGNVSPYVVTWDDNNTIHDLVRTGLPAGTYGFIVVDANLCDTTISNIVITEPTALVVSVTGNDVSCFGGSDGSIDIAIASGNPPYVINWSGVLETGGAVSGTINPANTIEIISSREAGTYTVDVADNVGNTQQVVVVVAQPTELIATATVNDISCFGEKDGSIIIIGVTSTGRPAADIDAYQMVWNGPSGFYRDGTVAAMQVQNGLSEPGVYNISIFDGNNCPLTLSYTLLEPNELIVNVVSVKDITCNGGTDGEIAITVSGRPAGNGYIYDWYNWNGAAWVSYAPNATPTIINLPAGIYHAEITSTIDGCTVISSDITVAENSALSLNTTVKSITSCSGDNSGELTIDVNGGIGPFTLDYGNPTDIRTGNGPFVISGLVTGIYNVTVTDANMCSVSDTYTITEPLPLVVNNVSYSIDCINDNTGVLNFDISGGSLDGSNNHQYFLRLSGPGGASYTRNVTIANGAIYSTPFTGLPFGSYLFEVQDKLSSTPVACGYTLNFDLELISITGSVTNATCLGVNTGAISSVTIIGSSGNYTYLWTTADGQGLDNNTLDQAGLSAGTYNLAITDNTRGCTVDQDFVVTNDNTLIITGSVKDVTCNGGNDGAVTNINITDATPIVTYTWTGPGVTNPATPEQTNITGGTYQLNITDNNGCAATETFFVNEPAAITFDLALIVEDCDPYQRGINLNNLAGGTGDVNNYQFYWTGPGSSSFNTRNLTGLTVGGTYTVTVKDENNCEVVQSITIPEELVITENVTYLSCNGATNGAIAIDITGGVGAFTYQWFKDNVSFANTKNIDNLEAATYKLVIIDAGESDGSQCTYNKDIVLSEPDAIVITGAIKHITCSGDADAEILLSVTGGIGNYSYSWSSGNGTGLIPTAKDQSGLSGGTYTVVVTDDNGCSATTDFTVIEPEAISFDLTVTDTQCDGTNGVIQIVNVTGGSGGGYIYAWAGPGIPPAHPSVPSTSGLIAGDYTITVWDATLGHTSCHLTKTVTLTSAIDLTYSVVPETCDGQGDGAITTNLQGGQPGYTYVWTTLDGSGVVVDAQNQAGLTEGTYQVTVTDTRACSVIQDILVARDNVINVIGAVTDVLCYGDNSGEIALTVSGGSGNYNYQWTGTGTGFVVGDKDQSGLSVGSYTVLVTDNVLGCEVTQTYNVRSPAAPIVITNTSVTDILCKGEAVGIIDISVTGGSPFDPTGTPYYNYQWSGPGSFTDSPTQNNLIAGDYKVTVTDANGCFIVSDIITVTEPVEGLTASVTDIVDVTVFGGSDGEIEIALSGGTGAYSIVWSGTDLGGAPIGGLTDDINRQTGLVAGNYNVDITDGNGCTISLTDIFVSQPGGALLMVVTTQDIIPCNDNDNGQINVNVTGGVLPYTITWFDSGNNQLGQIVANGVTIDNLPAGVYRVDVTDANSVTISRNDITILEPALLQLNTLIVQHVDCYESKTGIIRVQANGGVVDASNHYRIEVTGPNGYRVVRTDITEGDDFDYNNLASGVYNIRLTDDSNGDGLFDVNDDCVVERTLEINQPEAKVTVSLDSEICIGESTQIKFVVENWADIAANNLSVTLSDGSVVVLDESPHLYTVTSVANTVYSITNVNNGLGCDKGFGEGTATVVVNPLPTARIYSDREICFGETATIFVDLTGAAPWTVTYTDGTTSTVVSGIAATPFSFDVTPNDTIVYKVLTVQDTHCSNIGIDSVVVTVNERAGVTISGNADICYGLSTDINLDFSAGTAPYDVTLTENGVSKTLTGLIPDATGNYIYTDTPADTTEYILQSVTDAKGCNQTVAGSVLVTVRPYPEDPGVITGDNLVCQGATGISYSIDEVKFATNYVWLLPAGTTIASGGGSDSITVDFDNAFTSNVIRVYAENGCAESARSEMLINASLLPDAAGVVVGPTELCQASTGVMYSVNTITNANGYAWTLPAGFTIVSGDGTSSIIVNVDPTIANLTGIIRVEGVNGCGNGLPSADFDVEVTPLPVSFAGNDEEICTDTYTLQGNVVPGSQTGTWTILKGSGVIAPADIINPSAAITNLSQGENIFEWKVEVDNTGCFVLDTVVITNNQLTVIASVEERVSCDGTAMVHGTPVPAGADGGIWTFTTGNGTIVDATNSSTQVVNLDPDQNILHWTITKHGCQSFAEVEIISDQPDQAVISNGDSVDICSDMVTLTANNPAEGTGLWTLTAGAGIIDNPVSTTINVTGLEKGDNVLRWTIEKNGCFSIDEITVRNNQLDVDAGSTQLICESQYKLSATIPPAGVTGRWIVFEGAGTFDNGFIPDATVTGLALGTNRLIWELDQKGCISTDTITLINNEPTLAVVGAQLVVCADTVQLIGNAPVVGTGYWSVVSGSGRFDVVSDPATVARDIQEGTNVYRWTITNNGCSSWAEQEVENMKVYVNADKDTSICERTTVLNGNVPTTGTGEWNIVPGMGSATFYPNTLDPKARVGGLDYGNNVFVWTVNNSGCVSRDTVVITNNSPYAANAGADQIINSTMTHLNATPALIGIGSWSLVSGGANIVDTYNAYTEINGVRRGPNLFRWTVEHLGCTSIDEVIITNGEVIEANAGLNQTICESWTFLEANDPDVGVGEWSVVSGSGKLESPNNQKTRVYDLGSGQNVFRWTIYYTNSSSTDTVVITNNKVTVANAGPNRDLCGDTFTLEANIPSIGNANWVVISGSGIFADSTDPNTVISGLSQGANVLKYEISQLGCSSTDSVTIYNNLPTIADAGLPQTICADSVELHANTPTFGVGEWRVEEGSAQFDGNWAKELAPGLNKLVWVISSANCVSTDTVHIQNNQPSIAFAGHDRIVCVDSVNLSANIPQYGNGKWEFISGSGTIEDDIDPYSKVTGLARGANRFRWTVDNNGCLSSDDVEISNNLIPAIAGANQVNCADTAILEANLPNPGIGTWGVIGGSGSAIFEDTSNPYTVVRGLDHGDNELTWTINYVGCTSVSKVVIRNDNPTKAFAGENIGLCVNTTELSANTPVIGDGVWTLVNGGGEFVNDQDPQTRINNLKFGDNLLRWTITNNTCMSHDDVEVSFNRIDAVAGSDLRTCSTDTILEANSGLPGIGTWSVLGGGTNQAVFEDQNDPHSRVSNLAKGDNLLRWSVSYRGCETFDEVNIINNSPSTSYAGNSQELCEDNTILDATSVIVGQGHWEILTGAASISNPNDPKSPVSDLSKGDNVFRWTVLHEGCASTDEVLITNNRPSEPYAGHDMDICYSNTTLKADPPEFGTGLWSILQGSGNFSNPTNPDAQVENLSPGVNILLWTLVKGQCTLSDSIIVTNNSPTIANAGPDIQDCKDWSALDANIPNYGIGVWSVVSGKGDFDDANDAKTTVRNLGFGENILMWTVSKSDCFSSDQVVIFNQVPDPSDAGSNRTICEDYVVLNANNPVSGTGTWTVISGAGDFEDIHLFNTKVENVGFGENVYKWTIAYAGSGCFTESTVTVTSNKAVPFAGDDETIYESEYQMQAANPGTLAGTWSVVAGNGDFDDIGFFSTTVRNLAAGKNTFRWSIDVDGCGAYDDVTIWYKEVPDAGFEVDKENGCYPLDVKFTNYSVGGSSFYWDFGDGSTSTERHPVHTYTSHGEYTTILTVPGPDGQDAVYSKLITAYDHPVADFDVKPTMVYVPGDIIRLYDLSVDAESYLWDFGDGSTSDSQNPSHEYEDEGFYSIQLTVLNEFGCEDVMLKEDVVEAKMMGFVSFPNSFMPRPGGSVSNVNAIFKPVFRDVDSYILQIFNRWGQLIFESHDINEGWDGIYKGKLAIQAVYVWKASGTYVSGKEFRQTGSVLLVR